MKKDACSEWQKGVATLTITVTLLLVATIATLTVARVGLFEQKYTGLDVRGKEVHAAAVGGLEFGIQWFWDSWSQLSWSRGEAGEVVAPVGIADHLGINAGVDSYRHKLAYELVTALDGAGGGAGPVVVRVISTATAEADSHVAKTVSAELMLGRIGLFHGGDLLSAPPLVVEDCLSEVAGELVIYPYQGIAIGTSSGNPSCIDSSSLNLHGGDIVAQPEARTLSETIFGLPEEQLEERLREIEQREPERVYVVDLDDSNNPHRQQGYSFSGGKHGDWRTPLDNINYRPYDLYFTDAVGCPRIRGEIAIYGLVYYAATDCENHDWGTATIYGTVAVGGSIAGLSTTASVYGQAWDFSPSAIGHRAEGKIEPGLATVEILQLPGSWRDF